MKIEEIKDKKTLVLGIGRLGGGRATINWFIRHGARVTATDLKTKVELKESLKQIKGGVKFVLGKNRKQDIKANETIAVNPDVSYKNPLVKLAKKLGKRVENEATLFFKFWRKPIIAVTGTRGKTTTVNWINHFLNQKYKSVATGNSYTSPFLEVLDKRNKFDVAAAELSSFALEFFDESIPTSEVAVITNIYHDHLNRYNSIREYALIKANIFRWQKPAQHLILNYDSPWAKRFIKEKPAAKLWFFSASGHLPKTARGFFYKNSWIYLKERDKSTKLFRLGGFEKKWGSHNVENLLASSLAAYCFGLSPQIIARSFKSLPQVPFREEAIYASPRLKIINDTTATSPDGGIAAINRFGGPNCVLIAGGTDRKLDFKNWAKTVKLKIKPENLILLSGSATDKMVKFFVGFKGWHIHNTFKECFDCALERAENLRTATLLFSPASKSFEKFKNEFDRGRQFNELVKRRLKNGRNTS